METKGLVAKLRHGLRYRYRDISVGPALISNSGLWLKPEMVEIVSNPRSTSAHAVYDHKASE